VNVTATRFERGTLEVPGNVSVIEREDIERSGARDLPDLLRREAGIFVTNTTGNPEGYGVEARGFNNGGGNGSNLLVLVNGRRANEPGTSSADWALIHLGCVERVEIVRGPTSAVHGDNAIGGVVHIRTLRGEKGVQAAGEYRAGSHDLDEGKAFVGGGAGPVTGSVCAAGLHTDGYRHRAGFRARDLEAEFRIALGDRAHLGFSAGYQSDVRERPGTLAREQTKKAPPRREANPGADEDLDRARVRHVEGLLEWAITEGLSLRLLPYHRRREDRARLASINPFTGFTFTVDTETDSNGGSLEVEWDHHVLGLRNRLSFGGDLLREDVDSDSVFRVDFPPPPASFPASTRSSRTTYGGFLQDELELGERWILSAGVRFDHVRYRFRDRLILFGDEDQRPDYDVWSPKAALTYRITDQISAWAGYTRGFRFPNFFEASGFFGVDPELRPHRSHAYETGIKLETRTARAGLAVYHMNVKDEILFTPFLMDPITGAFFGRNVNFDRVRHRGAEVWGNLRPLEWLELYGTYTLDDARITDDRFGTLEGNRVPITPLHRGTAGVRLHLPLWVTVGVNANYVGSRYVANDLTNELRKLPRYATYDLHFEFAPPLFEHVEVALTFDYYNMAGRKYSEFAGRSSFVVPGVPAFVGYFPAPTRGFVGGIRVSFRR
jgi:iron complex outermembrane receptor protein